MEKIKIDNTEYEIVNIKCKDVLLEIEFLKVTNLTEKDLSIIELYTSGGIRCTTLTGYNTIYKADDNNVILSNDGSVYTEPTPPKPIEPSEPTEEELVIQLESAKKSKIAQSKIALGDYLDNNPLLFTDGNYYSVTVEKQSLLTGALALYDIKSRAGLTPTFKWNSTGETCVEISIETGTMLAIAIGDYVEPIVEHQRILEKQINLCTTMEELEGIVITYEKAT